MAKKVSTDQPAKPKKTKTKVTLPSSSKIFQIYHGTGPTETHNIIKQFSTLNDGVCLNMFKGYDRIKKDFERLEGLGLEIFMDNGSFERYTYCFSKKEIPASKRIPKDVYFSEQASLDYFEYLNNEYEKLLNASRNPDKLILTIPEVIASGDLTKKLQAKYLPLYKKWQKKYKFKMIVSLQFNAHDDNWEVQMLDSAKFIAENIDPNDPNVQRIGMPFGNDFKTIQNKENFLKVHDMFGKGKVLEGHKAHLFAAGSTGKVLQFTMDWVDSVDSSTINNWSKYAHYLTKDGEYIDVRDLRGIPKGKKPKGAEDFTPKQYAVAKARMPVARKKLEKDDINVDEWIDKMSQSQRFKILIQNFDNLIAETKGWKIPKLPALEVAEIEPAIAVSGRALAAKRSSTKTRRWDRLMAATKAWVEINGGQLPAREVILDITGHPGPYTDERIADVAKILTKRYTKKHSETIGPWKVQDLFILYMHADLYNKSKRC